MSDGVPDAAGQREFGWVQCVDEDGLALSGERIHAGGNSGYQALGLAVLWGAARVILLGYDMQATGGALHFHRDHVTPLGNPGADFGPWAARFARAARDLRTLGVEVVNCSRATAITAFERRTLDDELGPRPVVIVRAMQGLGDSLYQRPFVRELAAGADVYLCTPWPQLFADLEVTTVRSGSQLRTQQRNESEQLDETERFLVALPSGARHALTLEISYAKDQADAGIWEGLVHSFGVRPRGTLDLPPISADQAIRQPADSLIRQPIAVVRPVTVRREWPNPSRNPRAEDVAAVAQWLIDDGFYVVSVADIEAGQEEAVEPLPPAHVQLHEGELDPLQLLALVASAEAVVGGVGWIVPAAIAARVPAFFVLGGQGGHNAPERITAASMPLDLVGWGMPDDFCRCTSMRHQCAKGNSRLREQFDAWRLRVSRTRQAAVAS